MKKCGKLNPDDFKPLSQHEIQTIVQTWSKNGIIDNCFKESIIVLGAPLDDDALAKLILRYNNVNPV